MQFHKYHGTGNDFIIFEATNLRSVDYTDLARRGCNRHLGIGSDGMIVVEKSDVADIQMIFYNADGSRATMCGNGIRCFAKFVTDYQLVKQKNFTVETLAGIMKVEVAHISDYESRVRVNLGHPIFEHQAIPKDSMTTRYMNQPLSIDGELYHISTLIIGTIHTVLFVDDFTNLNMESIGGKIEHHPLFPLKTNVNFCQVINQDKINVVTWEKGVGLTLACGTGAAASAITSSILYGCDYEQTVKVAGGELLIQQQNEEVFMTGPATLICQGEYYLPSII